MSGSVGSSALFDPPILSSPYERSSRHWELDEQGQTTQKIIDDRGRARFITPLPTPNKRKKQATQNELACDERTGLSTKEQPYDPISIMNQVRGHAEAWPSLPSPRDSLLIAR